jgi:hypothetical protein
MFSAKVNLASGGVFVTGDGWINLDYNAAAPDVRRADLLGRLPLPDNGAALVYSSHFLEHIPRNQVPDFLAECWRILAPGGVLRLVLPDLENLCRAYLLHRERGEHEKADFVVLEMIDQCVRRESGGELGRLYRRLNAGPEVQRELIDFVRERTGENVLSSSPPRSLSSCGGGAIAPGAKGTGTRPALLDACRVALVALGLPSAKRQPRRCRRTASVVVGFSPGTAGAGSRRVRGGGASRGFCQPVQRLPLSAARHRSGRPATQGHGVDVYRGAETRLDCTPRASFHRGGWHD